MLIYNILNGSTIVCPQLSVLFLVVHSTPCTAQAVCDSINLKVVYLPKDVETPPTFVNGPEPLLRCIFNSLYPDCPITGEPVVIMMLEILDDGTIGRNRVLKTPNEQISNKMVKVIKSLKEKFFLPATINGTTVPCWFQFGISTKFL